MVRIVEQPYIHFLAHLEVKLWQAVTQVKLDVIYSLLQVTHPRLEELPHVGVPHEAVKNIEGVLLVKVYLKRQELLKIYELSFV